MVGRQSSRRSNEAFNLNSLRRRLEDVGRPRPILEDPHPTARKVAPWVIPDSDDDNMALDDIEEDNYPEDDAPFEDPDPYEPLAELPRVLRAGVRGSPAAANRGGNRGTGALRYFGRPRPYDAIVEGLQDRLQAEVRNEAAAVAAGRRVASRPALPGRVEKRPSPTAAERARRKALEQNVRGIPFASTSDSSSESPALNSGRPVSIGRPRRGHYPRFEWNLRDKLQSGKYDEEALRYYFDLISRSDGTNGQAPDFSDLRAILSNEARPGPEGMVRQEWTPMKVLGAGTYGEVILWQRITNIGMPPESLVCKTTIMDEFFLDWNEETFLTHKLNIAGCRNVVKVYDWNRNEREDYAKIIYEYCPYGDLQMLIDFYETQQLVFPEAFLWHIFYSIATAICYCARGTTADEPIAGWSEIVHKDLKPNNIFLSPPEDDDHPLYPTLKVADFGMGYEIPNETVRQFKRVYPSLGNHFGAPEIREEIRSDRNQTPYEYPSPRLDIYSLGVIMLILLQLPLQRYSRAEWECLDLDWEHSHRYYPYSPALVSLARQCVRRDALQRPDPFTLHRQTRQYAHHMSSGTIGLRRRAYQAGAPAGVYNGKLLYGTGDQSKYTTNDTYRRAFRKYADWFGRHAQALIDLEVAALTPQCPPRAGLVGIGNGLGGFYPEEDLRRLMVGVPVEQWLRRYEEQPEDNGVPNLQYIGQNRLRIPKYDKGWRAHITGVGEEEEIGVAVGKEEEEEEGDEEDGDEEEEEEGDEEEEEGDEEEEEGDEEEEDGGVSLEGQKTIDRRRPRYFSLGS